MTHVLHFLVASLAWVTGGALVAAGIVQRTDEALRVARALLLTQFLPFRMEDWRTWHARTILIGTGFLLLLAGTVVYLVAR
jgi:hypothetical protein